MNTDTYFRGVYPRILNHIANSVHDLEAAVNWYTEVLGFTVVKQAAEFVGDNSHKGRAVKDIHDPRLKKMKMAYLSSINQVSFEIIEYVESNAVLRQDNFEYWKSGITHNCVTDPDIDGLCKRISDSGGKRRTEIWEIAPEKKYKIAFCEDHFGNIIEIFDHSYEQIITSILQLYLT